MQTGITDEHESRTAIIGRRGQQSISAADAIGMLSYQSKLFTMHSLEKS